MKTKAITIAIILYSAICIGQNNNHHPLVEVTDWHDRGLLFVPDFFAQNKDSLITQIGQEEYQRVLKFGNTLAWPRAIQHKPGLTKDTVAQKHYHQQLSKLKMYKIAAWQQYFNNKRTYRYALLRVPYAENKHWDANTKWDTIYFIVKERSVKEQ